MITIFDVIVPLGILLAMALSYMPRQAAIGFCAVINLSLIAVDFFTVGWLFYYTALIVETFAALVLAICARGLYERDDRMFYRAMAAFFLVSVGVTGAFILDMIVAHKDYAVISHAVAFAHVFFMIWFSNGIQHIRNWLSGFFDRFFNSAA